MIPHSRMAALTLTATLCAWLGGAATAPQAFAQPSASANIDWQRRIITARGQGAPDLNAANPAAARIGAERAAQIDAFRNILETLKGVQLSGGQTVGAALSQNQTLRAQVEGELRNFKVIDRHYFSDGGVELTVEMSLDGKLAELLLPPSSNPQRVAQGGRDVGSGLVVVAKGLKVMPALAPRLMDESGKVVYGPDFVQAGPLRDNGIAGYINSESAADHSPRVGGHPLTIHAVKTQGPDLVISAADAAKLSDSQSNLGFLSEAKVLIVTD